MDKFSDTHPQTKHLLRGNVPDCHHHFFCKQHFFLFQSLQTGFFDHKKAVCHFYSADKHALAALELNREAHLRQNQIHLPMPGSLAPDNTPAYP